MTPPDIRAVLAKMQDDMCKGDLDAIYPYFADDIVFQWQSCWLPPCPLLNMGML